MTLVDEIELLNAQRLGYLVELANIRHVSMDEMIQRLEIKPLANCPLTTAHSHV